MKLVKNENGYTAVELITLVGLVGVFTAFCGVVYIIAHYLAKFW